jgi:hypothetical protein
MSATSRLLQLFWNRPAKEASGPLPGALTLVVRLVCLAPVERGARVRAHAQVGIAEGGLALCLRNGYASDDASS